MRTHEAFVCDVTVGPDGSSRPAVWVLAARLAVFGLSGAALAAWLAGGVGGIAGLLGAAVAVCAAVAIAAWPWRGCRQCVVLERESIKETYVLAAPRRTPWQAVVAVHVNEGGGLIETNGVPIRIEPSVSGWRRLLRVVATRLGQAQPSVLSVADLEERLGVPFGTAVAAHPWGPRLALVGVALAGVGCVLLACRYGLLAVPFAMQPVSYLWLASVARPIAVEVTPTGLRERRLCRISRLVDWDSICGTDRTNDQITIITDQGRIRLGRANPERLQLADGIDRLLAAREQGLAPPRLEHLSDAALSPAREVDVETTIDRGLSRSDQA